MGGGGGEGNHLEPFLRSSSHSLLRMVSPVSLTPLTWACPLTGQKSRKKHAHLKADPEAPTPMVRSFVVGEAAPALEAGSFALRLLPQPPSDA